jgi:hypothetical protein
MPIQRPVNLRITDSTTTVLLTSSTQVRVSYTPYAYAPSITSVPSARGGALTSAYEQAVTETFELGIAGDVAVLRSVYTGLRTLLAQAAQYQQDRTAVDRVYVQIELDTGDWWQSEILAGSITVSNQLFGGEWRCEQFFTLTVTWLRRPWWEEDTLTTLTISSSTTTTPGSSAVVENTTDTSSGNWLEIASTQITGDLPSPAQIEITSDDAGSNLADFRIGHNVYRSPGSVTLTLEGEDSTKSGTSSTVADADASDGEVETWTYAAAYDNVIATWTISSAQLAAANGAYVRVFAIGSFPGDQELQVEWTDGIQSYGGTDYVVGTAGVAVLDLGVLRMPPYNAGLSGLGSIDLRVNVRISQSGFTTLDCLQLLPLDGWLALKQTGFGVAQSQTLVYDPYDRYVYSGASKRRNYNAEGSIMLEPDRTQRLRFLFNDQLNDVKADRSITVAVKARQRRSML